ncbi:hypothetical protein FA15DRAFT_634336 [Coprinopsis marcescibilis]|uniref:Uncharacterized protein n=1 Tax=Coprinopsis marcescibilis TaxID=230819 RepID=A0A5C3L661_COPMA|nr:hypothetical protein FA15DRAFT_634336 [Coprinopsis marcescibilis]
MSQRSTGEPMSTADREKQRQKYRAKVTKAYKEDDDPLAAYNQFVQWTVKNYGEKDPKSGLKDLLDEVTGLFRDDVGYKNDLRYLKMWALHARQVERSQAVKIYAFLVENGIGTTYSALYEDYANLLEKDGRRAEAEKVYLLGIERQVRPLERLKTRYGEFQARAAAAAAAVPSGSSGRPGSSRPIPSGSRSASLTSIVSSVPSTTSANLVSFNSTAASRYALMLEPAPPGKRPEKLRFNMGLLFTDDGVEYSIQEARARSMGLLGKKWGPPPASELHSYNSSLSSSASSAPVDFNDDGLKSTRAMGARRRSMLGGAEPTVTINTKEALADVFGMYNSPDRTSKITMPGSKHAPLRKIEPATPLLPPRNLFAKENENAKTPMSFRPFADENAQQAKATPAFRPFLDENAQTKATPGTKFNVFSDDQSKTPFITPRTVFGIKDATTPSLGQRGAENAPRSAFKPLRSITEDSGDKPVVGKVFNPPPSNSVPLAPLRDVFTDDHGKPVPKPKPAQTHERAKSHDIGASNGPVFTPFVDENSKTPFKVFSLPSENDENALGRLNPFTPKTPTPAVFTPFADPTPAATPFGSNNQRAFTPFMDKTPGPAPLSEKKQPAPPAPEPESVEEHYEEEEGGMEEHEDYSYEDDEHVEQYETPIAPEHLPEEYEDSSFQQEAPLGGRFGQFNVMTPITERTFEFTTSTRATPSERYGQPGEGEGSPKSKTFTPFLRDGLVAAADARRLEAELQQDTSEENVQEQEEYEEEPEETYSEPQNVPQLEERTGTLSLVDTLTLNSKFRPPNPCNPFDPPIISTLLSRIQTDSHFFDLRDRSSQMLDQLQKHFKKSVGRKSNVSDIFPLTIEGNRFHLSAKLGEGGFGCVYKARDLGARNGEDSDEDSDLDDFDDDEENASMVAIKVVKPRNLWEYHVLRRLHSALPTNLRRSLILPHALYAYGDESFLMLDLCTQGMLLDVVNNAPSSGISQAGACLDELLVFFFAIELMRLVEGMHKVGFIHGDLKIDNCLLRLEDVPGGAAAWSSLYQPSGEEGWSHKGLKVIDFGRTIDTRLFPTDQQFVAEWTTDERDCFEIQQGRPWTYQTDYFGLAGIIYCMLFGKYISASVIAEGEGGRFRIATPFKRYWQADIWNRLFDVLLNPIFARDDGSLPLCEELADMRKEMEDWLQANCNRTSNTLKGLLKKVEMSCYV